MLGNLIEVVIGVAVIVAFWELGKWAARKIGFRWYMRRLSKRSD